jgi:hypothetical protein
VVFLSIKNNLLILQAQRNQQKPHTSNTTAQTGIPIIAYNHSQSRNGHCDWHGQAISQG